MSYYLYCAETGEFHEAISYIQAGCVLIICCINCTGLRWRRISRNRNTFSDPSTEPTNTATPRPTSTPYPTLTEIPPTPTPAAIGVPVKYESLEITVLDVKNLDSVHFGDVSGGWETFYKPLPGKFLIDVGVLVRNLDPGNPVLMDWMNVYIVEESGNAWYPGLGEYENSQRG